MISKADFESETAGQDIYQLSEIPSALSGLTEEIEQCSGHIICKVNINNFEIINHLIKNGFEFASSTIFLECHLKRPATPLTTTPGINKIALADLPELQHICDESFYENNRYANDPLLHAHNTEIHRKWLANSISGYADHCYKLCIEDKLAGFGTLHLRHNHSSIGLLAIASEFRRHGAASKIIEHLKYLTLQHNLPRIIVGTEAGNYPALKLYYKHGFSIYHTEISLYREQK